MIIRIAIGIVLSWLSQGCDGNIDYRPKPRHPDFQGGGLAIYYNSAETADVVVSGVTYKIGHGVSQAGLPFSYEWEEDGDVDIQYNGREYEIESPHDAADDLIEALTEKRKKKKLASRQVSVVKSKNAAPSRKLNSRKLNSSKLNIR